MKETNKKNLNLSVEEGLAEKAKAQGINISKITENLLKITISASETTDKEKQYRGYQELFKLMLPLLQKFKVNAKIATEYVYTKEPEQIGEGEFGEPIYQDSEPSIWFKIHLQPDGKLHHEQLGEIKITDIKIIDFLKPQHIVDEWFNSIQEGVNYRKEQFKEIEMAKTIIDAITKGVIPKTKSKGKGKKK